MSLSIVRGSRICLLVLIALVAILSVRVAGYSVARADDPVPTYYFSAVVGTGPTLASYWGVDTGLTQGAYHIYKIINVQGNPLHSEQRIRGVGPDGDGDYKLMLFPLQPGGEDDLPLAFFYVSGL
jgi:hypothetical protein